MIEAGTPLNMISQIFQQKLIMSKTSKYFTLMLWIKKNKEKCKIDTHNILLSKYIDASYLPSKDFFRVITNDFFII